jgi:peptidoglycan/xylan/chitin deacetylase (PgdA/CDA1 family)
LDIYSASHMKIDHQKLLQGRYEAERLPRDFSPDRFVPDFAFNVLNPFGLLYRPVVDEEFLRNGGKKPGWPDRKPFAVCLTHDVDAVSLYSLKQSLRSSRAQFLNNNSTFQLVRSLIGFSKDLARAGIRREKKDPLHCFEKWLEAEKSVEGRSTFFFWPGLKSVNRRHISDRQYDLSDTIVFDKQKCSVGEMIQEIDCRGWEIGLHASWYSFNNVDEMERQKEALEIAVDHEIVSIRQHYLHYDIRFTPYIQNEVGLKYDSTLGFNDNVGFRFGTCYPWHLYDLENENELSITEVPLVIQDCALLHPNKGMRTDEDIAFQYIVQLTEEVESVGGVLTLLWHPEWIIRPDWWNLYLRTLKYLLRKNPWFASVKEVGEWWKSQANKNLGAA